MRKAFLTVVAIGTLVFAAIAVMRDEHHAFTIGVPSGGPVVPLKEGDEVCQGIIDVPEGGAFDVVRVRVGTYFRKGPAFAVTVESPEGRRLASGAVAAGFPDITQQPFHDVKVGRVDDGQPVRVCVANRGPRRMALYGNGGLASRATSASLGGTSLDVDVDLVFRRSEASSSASLVPVMFERASQFRPAVVDVWTYWLLLGALLLGAPALLAWAIGRAER